MMKLLYYRIYYTIYRALVWLEQRDETDMIRVNVFVLLSLFTMLIIVGIVIFLIGIMGQSFIINSRPQSIALALLILAANAYIVFYKKRYREIENKLSTTWERNKSKNILLTLAFSIFSIAFFCFSIIFIKAHPLTK